MQVQASGVSFGARSGSSTAPLLTHGVGNPTHNIGTPHVPAVRRE